MISPELDPVHRANGVFGHYSPECVEGGFSEVRLNGVLRSSLPEVATWQMRGPEHARTLASETPGRE